MTTAVGELNCTGSVRIHLYQEKVQQFTDIVINHMSLFHRQALRRLGNVADAEDAVQEALLSAFTHVDQFKGRAQMSTWLTTIVINATRMQLRRRLRQVLIPIDGQGQRHDEHVFGEGLLEPAPSPEEVCQRWELWQLLSKFSTQLSPNLLRAFQLRHVRGLSIRETADVLGVPLGTAKARVARARVKLKRLFQKRCGGEAPRDLRFGARGAIRVEKPKAVGHSLDNDPGRNAVAQSICQHQSDAPQ